jgi:hypothetical protein
MKTPPMPLPWTLRTAPHAVLDILRGCNIRCRDCFNSRPDRVKSLREIEEELDTLLRLRKLHSLAIVGGEITLHPQLVEVVRMVKGRGLFVELFSNGVDLEPGSLARLKEAGTDLIFLHIEPQQRRPDLSANASREDLRRLRAEKTAQVVAQGIEAGLAVTVYPDRLQEAAEAVDFTLESPDVCCLLVTLWRDVTRMPPISGSLEDGLRAFEPCADLGRKDRLTNPEVCRPLEEQFRLTPFAFVGSNIDPLEPRWLSYLVAAVHRHGVPLSLHSLRPTLIEKAYLAMTYRIAGRYPFYQAQNAFRFSLQLLFNALAGGGVRNLKPLLAACRPGAKLTAKKLLFQCAASVDAQGRVAHCHCCPDAVVQDGKLVPLCVSDQVVSENRVDGPAMCIQKRTGGEDRRETTEL